MKNSVVIIGIGEVGGVFARGFLKAGYPVFPVTRSNSISDVSEHVKNPEAVIVAVGEKAMHPILESLPSEWKSKVVLIQNELLPHDWTKYDNFAPTFSK